MKTRKESRPWDPRTEYPPPRFSSGGFLLPTRPLVVVLGPTASGKSGLAIRLAKRFGGSIIGADSRQVYEGMEIGTAQPRGKWQLADGKWRFVSHGIPHFLLGHVRANTPYTVARYQREVFRVLKTNSGIPFLVGGTGLYIDAVTQNWDIPKVKPNRALRQKLEKQTLTQLAKRLTVLDPESARSIDMKNRRRIIRALEVVLATKQSFLAQKKKRPFPFRVLKIGLSPRKNVLEKNIRRRVHAMFLRGLVAETKRLLKRYSPNLPAMSGIGYQEVHQFIRGKISKAEAIERIVIRTRQYAKRQMSWFKRDPEIHWVRSESEAKKLIDKFIE